ncbi:hypothetical protein O4273_26550 [Rhodococcus ruber]|uniref:hypothetical protein n=1 Tax=Rhodococcus ruber TaxID=1830 RepID=UPI0022B5AA39|nr:hypothetical protein [Rhodococcus ruber]MCZ4506390.1 hypothetical protein [Rhodococcus ruber]
MRTEWLAKLETGGGTVCRTFEQALIEHSKSWWHYYDRGSYWMFEPRPSKPLAIFRREVTGWTPA